MMQFMIKIALADKTPGVKVADISDLETCFHQIMSSANIAFDMTFAFNLAKLQILKKNSMDTPLFFKILPLDPPPPP